MHPASHMRMSVLILSSLLAATVHADRKTPAVNLTPILADELPARCRPIAKQASAANLGVALGARISLANCMASEELAPLQLCDCADSILEMDNAVAPAVALLDEVAHAGDAHTELLAEHARGELYTSMRIRMAKTIPTPDSTEESLALRDARQALLETQLVPWSETIDAAAERVLAIAKANPALAKHPIAKTAIEASKQRVASRVAEN
jgi:hypothetical protein